MTFAIDDTYGTQLYLSRQGGMLFQNPETVIEAAEPSEVGVALTRVESAIAEGRYAAGWVAYEAGPAFDSALAMRRPDVVPVLWFGIYHEPTHIHEPMAPPEDKTFDIGEWKPLVSKDHYLDSIRRIRAYLAAGDVYQVNYTFPLEATFAGDTLTWFQQLCAAQDADYCAYVNAGRFRVLSASPELFFHIDDDRITTRPMKGTRPRGRWLAEDEALAEALQASEKDRAENVMIVDLLRNDLGRIAYPGTVETTELFAAERYPTVWQLTSTVTARTRASMADVFRGLFPCGSVTGAPKVRMTQIARKLEPYPRGVYCGSVGWWGPGRKACFNVAIRTVTVDIEEGWARCGVGGGITWDSSPEGEYDECRVKARFLTRETPRFDLLESLRWDQEGYFLQTEHLDRLMASAAYFGWSVEREQVVAELEELSRQFTRLTPPQKVRVLVNRQGMIRLTHEPIPPARTIRLGFAQEPVDSADPFLYHKTTHRTVYTNAQASRPDCDDVLLWNQQDEITESATANVVVEFDGQYVTPPLSSGLLAGTFRRRLLEKGVITEAALPRESISEAKRIWLINSVRRWIAVEWHN